MRTVTIAEFKRQLPSLLEEVAQGDSILLQKGHRRDNVAILTPYPGGSTHARQLGPLSDRGAPIFEDWSLTEEAFLAEGDGIP